ncbi:Syndetin [Frankliniella fusca]|uniref:Syndetin n=1 Tax=Frankliniella fusca TaxID=407009 RepID=A0AAE1I4K8_9NEOP|nr:Syndetin [Frankliniella fusca]
MAVMGDFKQRFSGLLNKLGNQSRLSLNSPSEETLKPITNESSVSTIKREDEKHSEQPDEILSDDEILEMVEKDYFKETEFDPSRHELKKINSKLNCDEILIQSERLHRQQKVVSKKVLSQILTNQRACNEEFERIQNLQSLLRETLSICRDGRSKLNMGKQQLTTTSLGILANYRKRQLLRDLLSSLNTIKTLQRSEEHIQVLLSEYRYEDAISQLLDCQSAASSLRRFACVAALSSKLQDTLVMTEEQLDVALGKICEKFDETLYGQLQAAYAQLGKTQAAMDQLHMHFTSSIQNTALKVIKSFVGKPELGVVASGKQYNELCKNVREENFIPCLQELCTSLWRIVCSHHRVALWHQKNLLGSSSGSKGTELEVSFTNEYIRQKMESMQARIWHDVQARFSTYLFSSDLASFKFDNFLQVLGLVHRLMEVGEEFCGSQSEELQKSVRLQSENYFGKYHVGCLEELRIFLENESWTHCPVKNDFSCLQLQEFRSLRGAIQNVHLHEQQKLQQSPDSSNQSQDGSSVAGGFFAKFAESGSPFDLTTFDLQEEDILANIIDEPSGYFSDDSDEDVPEELRGDFVDEGHGESAIHSSEELEVRFENSDRVHFNPKKAAKGNKGRSRPLQGPLLTNTTLTVLRHCGKYLQMSRLLRTVAMDVIICLTQLFQYYLYAVNTFFTSDLVDQSSLYSIKLQATLKRINMDLIRPEKLPNSVQQTSHDDRKKVPQPHISPIVNLNNPENLFGLSERVVAVESLVFLAEQLDSLRPYLEHLVRHEPRKHLVQQFYLQMVSVASDLRLPVYACISSRTLDLRSMLNMMGRVNWEIKEVSSQHSQYVDFILREMQIFSMRLEEVASHLFISKDVYDTLWEALVIVCCNTFVEGFSNARKCATGGRALMQLDFTQFISKLEKLTTLRPIPYKEFVEVYVKAYYLPEELLEKWIREHPQYSSKQLQTLVHCTCQNNKKTRQRLSGVIEELERVGLIK